MGVSLTLTISRVRTSMVLLFCRAICPVVYSGFRERHRPLHAFRISSLFLHIHDISCVLSRKRKRCTANFVQLGCGKSTSSCFYSSLSGYSVRFSTKEEKSPHGQQGLSCGHHIKRFSIIASAQQYGPLYRQDLGISAGTTISSSDMNSFVTFRTRRLHLLGPCLGARPKQDVGSSTSQHMLRPPRAQPC